MTIVDPIYYSIVLLTGDNPNDPSGENDDDDALATSTVSEASARQMIRSTVLNLSATTDNDDDDALATSAVPEAVATRRMQIRSTVLSLGAIADGDNDNDATLVSVTLTARRQMIRSTVLKLDATADGRGRGGAPRPSGGRMVETRCDLQAFEQGAHVRCETQTTGTKHLFFLIFF